MPPTIEERDIQTHSILMPDRGLVTIRPGLFLDPRFSPQTTNSRFFGGEVLNRPGRTDFPDPPVTLDGIPNGGALFEKANRNDYTVISTQNKIYYLNAVPDPPVWTDITGAGAFSATSSDSWAFAAALDFLAMGNDLDGLWYWADPTTDLGSGAGNIHQITGTGVPSGVRYLAPYANRLIAAHINDGAVVADRVRWSKDGDITLWDPAVSPSAGANDTTELPGPITGLRTLGGFCYIYKRNGIVRMVETGLLNPAFGFQKAYEGIGTVEGRTIVEINGRHYFLGDDDVYRWDGAGVPESIGAPIRDNLLATLNTVRLRQCFAFEHRPFNEYVLCIVVGTSDEPTNAEAWATRAFAYNYIDGSWSRWDFASTMHVQHKTVGEFLTIDDMFPTPVIDDWVTPIDAGFGGGGQFIPLLGNVTDLGAADGRMFKLDDMATTDVGAAIPLSFDTHDFTYGPDRRASLLGTLHRVILTLRDRGAVSPTVQISGDGGATFTNLGSKAAPGLSNSAVVDLSYPARLTSPQVRSRITTSDPLALLKITYEYFERSQVK